MKQRGSLTVCSKTRGISIPKKDFDGNIYGWETDVVKDGFNVVVYDSLPEEIRALELATMAGDRSAIHKILEHLSQIKPIGKSDIKQTTRISYLVYDLVFYKISEFVVEELATEYRRNQNQTFFPDHAEFLNKAIDKMEIYKTALELARNPLPQIESQPKTKEEKMKEAESIPEWKKCETKWEDWNESVRADFINHHKDWDRTIFKHLVNIYGISVEDFNAECERRSKPVDLTV